MQVLITEGVEGKGGRVRMRKEWRGETEGEEVRVLAMNAMQWN